MKLKVLLPNEVLLDTVATKVVAEAANGFFCLLPRHADFATAIVPGILVFNDATGQRRFLATDEGTLVKCGEEVLVSTQNAAQGGDLGQLKRVVEEQFESLDERERTARSAATRLEAGLVRRFMELAKHAVS